MLKSRTHYQAIIEFFDHCLEKTREYARELDEARVLAGYGRVLTNINGDLYHGAKVYQQALEIRNRHLQVRDYHLAFLHQSYGWNLGLQGRYKDAIQNLRIAHSIEQELGMHSESLILQTMQSLALFYSFSDDFENGERFQIECYKIRLKSIGTKNHPIMGSVMNNMGILFLKKGDFDSAFEYHKEALEIKIANDAPIKAIALSERALAETLLEKGEFHGAILLLEQGLSRLQAFPGLFDDVKALLFKSMGRCYLKSKSFAEAESSLKKAIDLTSKVFQENKLIIKVVGLYAEALLALGKYREVVLHLEKALFQKDNLIQHKPTDLRIYRSYRNLVEAYFSLRNREKVVETYERGYSELLRLIKVFEDIPDFLKRQDMSNYLCEFTNIFEEMMKDF